MSQGESRKCKCKAIDTAASDEDCPILFDEALDEYNIVSRSGNAYYRMYYCFFCGGLLPESRRAKLYANPEKSELDEINKLLGKLKTVNEVIGVLGPPDNESDPSAEEKVQAVEYRKHYCYLTKWKSLNLTVRGRVDNSFDLAVVGKFRESDDRS